MALLRCFAGLWLPLLASYLVVLAAAGSGAGPPAAGKVPGTVLPKEHRVIVRFTGKGGDDADAHLDGQVEKITAHGGVVSATGLRQLGMIVVACESQEAQEKLVEHLDKDPEVELAVPDMTVTLRELAGERAAGRDLSEHLPAKCSAHPACAARGLVGDCCPAPDGMRLSCCSAQDLPRVAFRSYHGKYLSADGSGLVTASALAIDGTSTFFIDYLGEGNVSLSTLGGKFLSAGADGGVTASRVVRAAWETFHLNRNENGTISLLSRWQKYLSAQPWGGVFATAENISLWEQFEMVSVPGPNQRFPNDASFSKLWGMHHYAGNDIDAPEAWQVWTGEAGAGITVGVIDTGIDYRHEDLQGQMWVNVNEIPGNGIDDDGNGFVDDIHGADFVNEDGDPWDDQMHGTHCSGTIAGRGHNNLGVAGVTWRGVRLMGLKFLSSTGSGQTSDAIKAIDYAIAHGARILSNSWGGGGSSSALRVAIERAEAAGILFLAAAGNSGTDNDEEAQYPSNYETANVVAVASTTAAGALSSFSCFGAKTVHLAAPGSAIWSTVPGNGYESLSGTSMATPHVSGLAALVWTFRPALSMHQVRDILLDSVRKQPWLEGKVSTGGMINAKNAIEAAWAFQPPTPPTHAPAGIQFVDADMKVGLFGGVVTVTAAADETDVEYYRVYFVSAAGYMVDPLGDALPANGAKEYTLEMNGSITAPQYATRLAAVAGRASGEQPVVPGPNAPPSVALEDVGVPDFLPKAVVWGGDTDLRSGFVKGTLFIDRASDESTITQYNIYWHNADGTRGEKLGEVPAVGFMEPSCSGPSCSLLRATVARGGVYRYERGPYGPDESAIIKASGPANVTVLRFDSEQYYDWLSVGTQRFTGALADSLPEEVVRPEGPLAITWFSDSSINGGGWSIELKQEGGRVPFDVATARPSPAVEVVPAYRQTELPAGTVVQLADFDGTMPPSPAFAPEAVLFQDADPARGRVAGVATVRPAAAAGAAGSGVTYYALGFADKDGAPLGEGWNLTAGGNASAGAVNISSIAIPAGAVALLARAGGAHGLAASGASTKLEDMYPSPPANASFEHDGDGRRGFVAFELVVQAAPSEVGITAYVAYWYAQGKKEGKLGSAAPSGEGDPTTISIPRGTRKHADHLIVVSAYAWGETTDGVIVQVVDALNETRRLADDVGPLPTPGAPREIWLQQPRVEKPILAWSADMEEELSTSAATFGRVRCSVTVPGLDARAAAAAQARSAFERAIAAALPGVRAASVRVVRVLAVTRSKAGHVVPGGRRLAAAVEKALGRHPAGATVDFEVEAPEDSAGSAALLDRVEARLILLSNGGGAAARFDDALASELRAADVLLPKAPFDRSRVHEPQQMGPRLVAARHHRARAGRQLEGVPVDQETGEEEAGSAVLSAMAAAVGATAAIALAAFAVRRRGGGGRAGPLLERGSETLQGIAIDSQGPAAPGADDSPRQ